MREYLPILRKILLISIIGLIFTVGYCTTTIFNSDMGLLLIPIFFPVFMIGYFGIITIPVFLYKIFKKQKVKKILLWFVGISFGFFIGTRIQKPIDKWDERQRNIGGKIVSEKIEEFKIANGVYPESIKQINLIEIDSILPQNYKSERFYYQLFENEYTLWIHILTS